MDKVLEELKTLETNFKQESVERVRDSTEWIVRFALSVSKACSRDGDDVFDACRNVVAELEAIKVFFDIQHHLKRRLRPNFLNQKFNPRNDFFKLFL